MRCGGMSTGLGVLSPGFPLGFCCVTLGKSLSLSGYLCYKWTRLFQRSLKTVIPMPLPQNEDYTPRGLPSSYPASWGPWGPRWAAGQGAGCVHCPSWTLKLYCRSANALSTASPWQTSDPLGGGGACLAPQPAPTLTPATPCSRHSQPRGLSRPRFMGLAFLCPQRPWRGSQAQLL